MAASKRVLLTGANGYIAQHILSEFLEAGYSVRSIVRSQSKVDQLKKTFAKYPASQLDFGVVPDMTVSGAFDDVLKSTPPFSIVLHTASPFNYRQGHSAKDFLDPAIKGTTEILHGVKRVAPEVERLVLTSSMAAVIAWADKSGEKVYTGADWNPVTYEEAINPSSINTSYQASKKFAEKAAWDFVQEQKPNFQLVTLAPPMVYGPVFDASQISAPSELNQSVWNIYNNFVRPGLTSSSPLPPTVLDLYVDVRDLARAHFAAATKASAGGKRIVVCGGAVSNQKIANIIRDILPEKRDIVPLGEPDKASEKDTPYYGSTEEGPRELGITYRPAEATIGDMALQYADIESRASK